MLPRERFIRCLTFKEVDRIPLMEMGVWPETLERWHQEGLPWWVTNLNQLEDYLGLDKSYNCDWLPVEDGFHPTPVQTVLEEAENYRIIKDSTGFLFKQGRRNASIPQYLHFPVEDMSDYQNLKPLLNPTEAGRYSPNHELDLQYRTERGEIRGISFRGLYGFPRELMGMENWSIALFDQPELVEEILTDRVGMAIGLYERILASKGIDMVQIWEDMAYKNGPLMSPDMMRRYMMDGYRRIVAGFKQAGVPLVLMDCDGYIEPILPIIQEAGIDGIYPCERAAGSDPVSIRKKYPDIALMGGVDKRAVAQGRESILQQMHDLQPVIRQGGFIPFIDHFVPPDISYQDYLYYVEVRRELLQHPAMKINPNVVVSLARY